MWKFYKLLFPLEQNNNNKTCFDFFAFLCDKEYFKNISTFCKLETNIFTVAC